MNTPTGKTKGQGWEIGVRRTMPIEISTAWELLMTPPGLEYWLGTGVEPPFKKGAQYMTEEHTVGEIRSFAEGSLIRLTWQPQNWNFQSTLQIRLLPAAKGTTISIHHEKLQNTEQREAMRLHWSAVLDKLEALVKKSRG
jgi:uncharacterized protein YndB with AHSA1/START domain